MRGKPDPVRGSMQGTYVLTVKGKLLGARNSANPDRIIEMLEAALVRWRELSPEDRAPPTRPLRPRHRWEDSYPAGGLILERFARDIGPDPSEPAQLPVNRDAVWFAADEVDGWLPKLEVGAKAAVSQRIVDRLARLALVDNVRGQTLPFAAAELHACSMQTETIAVRDNLVEIRITGSTQAEAKGPWLDGDNYWKPRREWPRAVRTRLYGLATFDREARRFTKFELVATGTRSGRTAFNRRATEKQATPHGIGFLLRLAPTSYRVAPTFVNMYGAKWVVPPPRPR